VLPKSDRTADDVQNGKSLRHYNFDPDTENRSNVDRRYLNIESKDHLQNTFLGRQPGWKLNFHPLYQDNLDQQDCQVHIPVEYIDHYDNDIGLHCIHSVLIHSIVVHR
jgi:hypothetical protein